MECYSQKTLQIKLYNDDLDTMANLIRLAHERLELAPHEQMRGIPVVRRAGLVGPEQFAVQRMIEKIAGEIGVTLTASVTDAPLPGAKTELVTIAIVRNGVETPREAT